LEDLKELLLEMEWLLGDVSTIERLIEAVKITFLVDGFLKFWR